MGAGPSFTYSVPVTDKSTRPDETVIYRHPQAGTGPLMACPEPEVNTVQAIYLNSVEKYGSKPYLYQRAPSTDPEGKKLGPFQSKTYEQVHDIAKNFGAGILKLGLTEKLREYENFELQFLGIYSKNNERWVITDQACALYNIVVVPIYDTLGIEAVRFVFSQTNLTTIVVTANYVETLSKEAKAGNTTRLKNLIIMDYEKITPQAKELAESAGLQLLSFESVVEAGQKENIPFPKVTADDIYTFSYTSGTTGVPKAAMMSHRNLTSVICAAKYISELQLTPESRYLSYLPLAHVFERILYVAGTYVGAHIAFYNGDVLKIKEDLKEFGPSVFASVPRLYNRFHDVIRENLGKLTGLKKRLADRAIATKLHNLRTKGTVTHPVYDRLVFNKIRDVFGGRIVCMLTGSAPISRDVIDFLKIAACVPILEGYGQTETMGASLVTYGGDPLSGHVGGPAIQNELKIRSVEDMKYTVNDKTEKGEPTPRGEILMRGPANIVGYYKDKEKTKETIDEEGWVATGDIVVLNPNGSVRIIDRKKNIFKLQQGEYVAPEKVEGIISRHKLIAEAFIYGDSLQNHLVAILVPNKDSFLAFAEANNIKGTYEELCNNDQLKQLVLKEVNAHCKAEKLNGIEQPRVIHIEPLSFGNHGLFTTTFKLKRTDARDHYKDVIKHLYTLPTGGGSAQ